MSYQEVSSILSHTNGEDIFCKHFFNKKKVRAKSVHIFFFHDLYDYHKRYQDFVNYFEKESVSFSMSFIDLPGQGYSHAIEDMSLDELEQICLKFINQTDVDPQSQIYLAGQGFGALLALGLVLKYQNELNKKIAGIILSNPMLKLLSEDSLLSSIKKLTFNKIKVCGSDLTTDVNKVNEFDADLRCRKNLDASLLYLTSRLGYELRGQAFFVKVPVLFLLSKNDILVDSEFTKLFMKGIDKSLVTMREYQQVKHDLLNELNREVVYSSIKDWVI